ncbi:MAG: SpoVR family protein, partial [Planctomycetota bacterium]
MLPLAHSRRSTDLPPELLEHMAVIKAKAIGYGLDFYETVFEVLDFDTMNQIAAYGGFPVRYPHWKWGAAYDGMKKRDAYGLGRIYEMVINNDPCYAYLQESNSVTDQKLVMAHVYGHADFFKHNFWFSKTNRKMIDQMANHATRVRRHIERQGQTVVERFIDRCLSIEHLIDPHSVFVQRESNEPGTNPYEPSRLPAKDYMDPFVNPQAVLDAEKAAHEARSEAAKSRFPAEPMRDVLRFLMLHAPLEDWQADILSIIRDEAYYFAPQAQTKVMNEGWATYWHSKLMTNHFLDSSEIIHYADQHSGVVHMAPGGFNPYKIGVELFKDIERRWDRGQHGPEWDRLDDLGAKKRHDDGSMAGRDKIFQIRSIYN